MSHPAHRPQHALTVSNTARKNNGANQKHQPQLTAMPPPLTTKTAKTKSSHKSIRGMLNDYSPKNGLQYYKDLAGNVKQVIFILV